MVGLGARYWIELPADRSLAVYFPGEMIEGHLYIQSTSPVPLPRLHLQLMGQAKVLLRKFEGKKATTYVQYEPYIKKREAVKDLNSPTEPHRVPPNTSVFQFKFFLPPGSPLRLKVLCAKRDTWRTVWN